MQIVPPPNPHKEALLRKQAKELPHLLIHKPANPYCEICNRAKVRERPSKHGATDHGAEKFGDYVTADFIIDGKGNELVRGVGDYKDALTLRDLGTGVKMCYPHKGRSQEECDVSLRMFGGFLVAVQISRGFTRIQRKAWSQLLRTWGC